MQFKIYDAIILVNKYLPTFIGVNSLKKLFHFSVNSLIKTSSQVHFNAQTSLNKNLICNAMGDIGPDGSKNVDGIFKTSLFVTDKLLAVLIMSVK